jgi:hypothetical protein
MPKLRKFELLFSKTFAFQNFCFSGLSLSGQANG